MVGIDYIKISFIIEFSFQFFKLFTHPAICGHRVPNRFFIVIKGHKLECVVQATVSDVC
jgi:hypothetical protein